VTAEPIFEPSEAMRFQMGIEGVEALERRDGNQEVPTCIPHQTFHLALVVPFGWTAELVLEQVVELKLREHPGPLPATISKDPCHCKSGVVVHNALGHSPQERKRGDMPVTE